jgi:hypothetical protein
MSETGIEFTLLRAKGDAALRTCLIERSGTTRRIPIP